jgi:hypothetical protein
MVLINSYKLDALWAKSIWKLWKCSKNKSKNIFWELNGKWQNWSYWNDLKCTSAGLFWDTEWYDLEEEEITTEIKEENISNYFQYLKDWEACWWDFIMKRELIWSTIDSMIVEASDCKEKHWMEDKEEDILKEIKEFWWTDILDWVVYIKVNEKPKDICDNPNSLFLLKYCNTEEAQEWRERREEARQNNIRKWKKKIEECATWQDAKTIKECYINNPHPDGQEVYAYKAVASLEYWIFKWSLVESDDFNVIQPTSFLNKDWEPCDWDGKPCNADGTPIEEDWEELEIKNDWPKSWESWNRWDWNNVWKKWTKWWPFILDNDFFDPDWVIMLQSSLAVDKLWDAELIGINLVSRDLNRRAWMMYDSIMEYNWKWNIPLWVSRRTKVRTMKVDATWANPTTQKYRWHKKDISEFRSDQCFDWDRCPWRYDPVELICKSLANSKEKVSYVIWWHLHNLADFLKETKKCNWKKLAREKLKQVVIATW